MKVESTMRKNIANMKVQDIIKMKNVPVSCDGDVIAEMKGCRYIPQPDIETAKKALDPELHDINNPILRPDKKVKVDADGNADSAILYQVLLARLAGRLCALAGFVAVLATG